MPDDDIALSEKRMYEARREATRAYIANSAGIAYVDASDDQIGRFGLDHQCNARDIAGGDGQLLVATDEDVLVGSEGSFEPTDFDPAVAVGVGTDLHAAGPDGRVARAADGTWETLGRVDDVRRMDGDLIAAADGVYHVNYEGEHHDPGEELAADLSHVGLDDARDVVGAGLKEGAASGRAGSERCSAPPGSNSAERNRSRDGDAVSRDDENSPWKFSNHSADHSSGLRGGETASNETASPSPGPREDGGSRESGSDPRAVASDGAFAATATGLYHRSDGWNREYEGAATVVAADGERAHAVVDGTLLERVEGEWQDADAPDGEVVDVAYDRGTFAVTRDGQVLLDPVTAKDGSPEWRTRSVGLADVVGIAIP